MSTMNRGRMPAKASNLDGFLGGFDSILDTLFDLMYLVNLVIETLLNFGDYLSRL